MFNFQTVAKERANKTNQVGICEFTKEKKLRRFFDRAQDEQCAFNHLNFLFSIVTLKIIYTCPENVLFRQDNYKVNVRASEVCLYFPSGERVCCIRSLR